MILGATVAAIMYENSSNIPAELFILFTLKDPKVPYITVFYRQMVPRRRFCFKLTSKYTSTIRDAPSKMTVQMRKGQQSGPTQPAPNGPWPSADRAVAMILLGERYANDRLHFISRIITLMMIALIISIIGNLAMFPNPPRYRYVPVSNSGLVLPQVPLTNPNHDDQYVIDWTIDAVTRLHSFDFMNYRLQLQDAQKNMTAAGWKSFQASLKESNNFAAILGNKFVLTAVPTGAGRIVNQELVNGTYTWTVQFPMLISYRSSAPENEIRKSEGRVISDALNMTITVSRVGVFLNHTGLGIKAVVAKR